MEISNKEKVLVSIKDKTAIKTLVQVKIINVINKMNGKKRRVMLMS